MTDTAQPRPDWTDDATAHFDGIVEANPTISGGALESLYSAIDLLSAADVMQRQVDADGLTVEGSQGQKVAHPLISEVRQYRKEALATIRSLGLTTRSAASAAGAALVAKRWQNRGAPAATGTDGATVTPIGRARRTV